MDNMINETKVNMADFKVTMSPDKLVTFGLGSCVGIILYEPEIKIGGLAHAMLPYFSNQYRSEFESPKFADSSIKCMLNKMLKEGAKQNLIYSKVFGGANMFPTINRAEKDNIGQKNIEATKETLESFKIPIEAIDVGGHESRTLIFDVSNGQVHVRKRAFQPETIY